MGKRMTKTKIPSRKPFWKPLHTCWLSQWPFHSCTPYLSSSPSRMVRVATSNVFESLGRNFRMSLPEFSIIVQQDYKDKEC